MINVGVAELACRDRLRSRDMKGKNKEEEKGKMHYYEEDEEDEEEEDEEDDEDDDDDEGDEEEEKILDSMKKVMSRKASTTILEKEKRRNMPTNLSDDVAKEDVVKLEKKAKNKDEKRMHGGDHKMKYRKAPRTTFDREKKNKFVSSHGREKKMRDGGHDKHKRRNTPLPLDKNKNSLKEKSKKMPSSHSGQKKMPSCDHHKDKRKSMHINSKDFEKEKRKIQSSDSSVKSMWSYDYCEHKGRRAPHPLNNNVMQKNEMKKKKKMWSNGHMEKKLRIDDNDEKARNGDRWKRKRKTMEDYNKEQKVQSGHKENRNVSIAFFKLIYSNFEEFLLLPPAVAPKLMDLTNRHVNLQDSEGKFSKVRLSMVDGSLGFYQGWNGFVSDHSIKLGDILLFEYTARSQFSVRVFGIDSCERVCFSVERQGGMKRKRCHAPDKTENVAVSGEGRVAVNSKEDPKRVVSAVEHGSSIALDDKDGYLANGKHKANDVFQTWSKVTRRSEIILITDEDPLTQENEDTEKIKTLDVASETHCVTAHTKEGPKGVASGAWCGPSMALDNKEGALSIGECKANCISSICSTQKTVRSEIIPVIEATPLAQENDDAVELTTFPLQKEDTGMIKNSEPEIVATTKCTEIHDSDEDLRREQEGNTVQLECTTAVDNCPNNSKMHTDRNICSEYEAPGGSKSVEKKASVSVRVALDGTRLIKPEKQLKTEQKLVDSCSSMGVNSLEQLLRGYAGRVALDGTGLIRTEKRLKTEDILVGKCSAMGVDPVEQLLRGYAGTHSCVQQTPGKISKSGHIKTEIDHCVKGKGPTVQPKTRMERVNPMDSIACRQQMNNIPVCADHAVARLSEHRFFRQEDKKSSHHVTPAALLPVKVEVLELDDHSVLKTNLQFSIPPTTQTWLELPTPLSKALRRKGRQDRNVVMLKDPMKRLWPVFYHENSLLVGFTRGWKPFVAANNLRPGDLCLLLKDLDEDEVVYHVEITRK